MLFSRIDDSCNTVFSKGVKTNFLSGVSCDYLRTTRAFMIIGLVFASLAFLMSFLGWHSLDDFMYRVPAMFFSLLSCESQRAGRQGRRRGEEGKSERADEGRKWKRS